MLIEARSYLNLIYVKIKHCCRKVSVHDHLSHMYMLEAEIGDNILVPRSNLNSGIGPSAHVCERSWLFSR